MSERRAPEGPYTVWVDMGYDGWGFCDYATLKEALEAQKYSSNWVIQKRVGYEVREAD
jgi:hypothetical protein